MAKEMWHDGVWYQTATGHLGYDNHLHVMTEIIKQFDWGQAFVDWLIEHQPVLPDELQAKFYDSLSEENLALLVHHYQWSGK